VLVAFAGCNNSTDFAATCIRQASNLSNRQRILNAAIRDFELSDVSTAQHDAAEFLFASDVPHFLKKKFFPFPYNFAF
jgi:hypothetical protein